MKAQAMPQGGDLTSTEERNVRTAIKFLRVRFGTWAPLAQALRMKHTTLAHVVGGHKVVSPTLAFRVAKFARVAVDDVIAGRFPVEGTCPMCGHHPGAVTAVTNGVPAVVEQA